MEVSREGFKNIQRMRERRGAKGFISNRPNEEGEELNHENTSAQTTTTTTTRMTVTMTMTIENAKIRKPTP